MSDRTTGYNYHFNDSFYLRVFPDMQGPAWYRGKRITPVHAGSRLVYVTDYDTGLSFNPAATHLPTVPDRHEWDASDTQTRCTAEADGVHVTWTIMTPGEAPVELWRIEVGNQSTRRRRVGLGAAVLAPEGGHMGARTEWDSEHSCILAQQISFHGRYDDYAVIATDPQGTALVAHPAPDAVCCSLSEFRGGRPLGSLPAFLDAQARSCPVNSAEAPVLAVRYERELEPGATAAVFLSVLRANDGTEASLHAVTRQEEWDAASKSAVQYLDRYAGSFTIDTPEPRLNDMVNRGLRREILWETRLWRNGISTPWRNELQDALGYAVWNPDEAVHYLEAVTRAQRPDGYLQVWNTREGEKPNHPLVNLRHTDGGIWLVVCWINFFRVTGCWDLWDRQLAYTDGSSGPLSEHLRRALEFSFADRGAHGLVLMHDGDWTDPMNGPGREGRGESGWATQALRYACAITEKSLKEQGDDAGADRCHAMADELGAVITTALSRRDGAYAYGYDDAGRRFGDETDGRTFLNTQSWGLISGAAAEDCSAVDNGAAGELDGTADGCARAIRRLATPYGPRLLDPAFGGWDPQIGRVSLKVPGTTENGSVYCHASVFAAYGLAMIGDADASLDIVLRTIPGHPDHTAGVPKQLALYQPNSYFYEPGHPQCGTSTGTLGTGTCTWMVLTVFQQYFGISFGPDGLRVEPRLPSGWERASVTFARSHTVFDIHVERSECDTPQTMVNGALHTAPCIAWEHESRVNVVVLV